VLRPGVQRHAVDLPTVLLSFSGHGPTHVLLASSSLTRPAVLFTKVKEGRYVEKIVNNFL
jgi:hypothetical protein